MLNKSKLKAETRELFSTTLNNVKDLTSTPLITLKGEMETGYSISMPSIVVDTWKCENKRYVAVTGESNTVFVDNLFDEDGPQINDNETISRVALLGDQGLVSVPTNNTTTCSMGDESNILMSLNDTTHKLTNSRAYVAGKLGGIHAFADSTESVFMSTADQGPIYDFGDNSEENIVFHAGSEGEIHYQGTNSQILTLGASSSVYAAHDNIIYNGGDETELNLGNNCTVFTTGINSVIQVGDNTVVYCAKLPVTVTMGVNSCLVMEYHDGTRNRVNVIYTGQGAVQSGKKYIISEHGQVSEVNTVK